MVLARAASATPATYAGSPASGAPYVNQETVEAEILAVLETVGLPTGYAEAVDAAMAAYVGSKGRKSRTETVRDLEERQRRLNEMYELGRLSVSDYKARSPISTRSGSPSRPSPSPS